ncbi:MAG: DUF4374 domain-containing protein [Myxococcota bacterium]
MFPRSLLVSCLLWACAGEVVSVPIDQRFAINQLVVSPEGFQSFAAFTSSLDATAVIDPAKNLPLPSASLFVAGPTPGSLLVSSGEAPEAIRFDVTEDGVLEAGRISFAGQGVSLTGVPPRIAVIDETKAYYLAESSAVGFVFDPTDMTIVSEFDLDIIQSPDPANTETVLGVVPARQGPDLLFPVLYRNLEQGTAATLARVVVINTETDAISVLDDDRCSYLTNVVVAGNGDIYVASDAFNGAVRGAQANGTGPSCILRIRSGELAFDDTFFVETESITGTPVSGGLVGAGGDEAYVLGYDETVAPLGASFSEINGTPAWRTYRVPLADDMGLGEVVEGIPPRTAALSAAIEASGSRYDAVAAADFSSTTLYRIDEPAAPVPALVLTGVQFGVVDLDPGADP